MSNVLTGRRVLELGGYLAAPFAGRILASYGAEVIKIEPPLGDATRRLPSPATFVSQNSGKRSVCLDLYTSRGREVFDRLLENADVVLHTLAPNATARLRLTADDCARVNPEIVYCKITAYGPGPKEAEVASNPLIEAATGVMFGNRAEGRPVRQALAYYDMAAGSMAVIAILAALTSDDRSARRVEVPLYEVGLYISSINILADQISPQSAAPTPGKTEFSQPGYGTYETGDGRWIYLMVLTDAHWNQFCAALADEVDPDFAQVAGRRQRAEAVEEFVRTAIRAHSYDEAVARLREEGLGFEEVRPRGDVLGHEQARVPGKLTPVEFGGHHLEMPSFPILSRGTDSGSDPTPPALGHDTIDVLESVGYDKDAIAQLLADGVACGV